MATTKTLYTSPISVESLNSEGRILEVTLINCRKKNVKGTVAIMDIAGLPVLPPAPYDLAPGKFFSQGSIAFGPGRPTVLAVYAVITITKGQPGDIRASLGIRDNKGYSTISVEAR